MAVTIGYDEHQRMTFTGLACDCPCEHNAPSQDIYVGTDLLTHIPEYIRRRGLGEHAVLVCDNVTYEIAGRTVEGILAAAGFDVVLCRIVRDGPMEPDELAVGEVVMSMRPETQFLISVGSGSVTDTTRVVAVRTGKPFVSVGTAPSMDGYTSVVAPLVFRGAKVHRQANCPEIIVCDLDVLRTAPLPMFVSGVGDVLGKYIAKADWVLGNLINDEPYCPVCGDMVLDAVNKLVDNVEEIKTRSEKGTRILIEALLLAGITIMIVGHTRAVASVEHNIAHYWEMQKLARHEKAPFHGTSVGVATLYVWPMFERFVSQDLSGIDKQARKVAMISREDRVKWMLHAYGQEIGKTFMEENPGDFLDWPELSRRIDRAIVRQAEIKAEFAALPPYEKILDVMHRLGAPTTAAELGIDDALLDLSLRCAKDYRTRYTLLKTLDELGLLESYLKG
ncbi:MAG TPA: sn-glycerol-1-phosphate dehydrogenase [Clostridia bacterium]|nr:sn-glycerol-1-phosphate dehydrogenase [Clostridia bacterium]